MSSEFIKMRQEWTYESLPECPFCKNPFFFCYCPSLSHPTAVKRTIEEEKIYWKSVIEKKGIVHVE